METTNNSIEGLREQENDLCNRIAELEETVAASSTAGIREFRMTRLRQLQSLHGELNDRLRRLQFSTSPTTDAYLLGSAFREATLVAQSTFGA
jgi:hypothetical protein